MDLSRAGPFSRLARNVTDNRKKTVEKRNKFSIEEMLESYSGTEGLEDSQIADFTISLTKHIRYVYEAGKKIGVPIDQLEVHDWSKWTAAEFPFYTMKFHPGKQDIDETYVNDAFALAWLDHLHKESHHWQHWIFPDYYTPKGSSVEQGAVEMPEGYIREMVADWMGASRAYTGSYDMTEWLRVNLPEVHLHSKSRLVLSQILTEIGYQEDITFLI